MADSKTFSGFPVQNFSADQTSVGQIYYNSASGTFKGVVTGVGSWASGGNLNLGRRNMGSMGGASLAVQVSGGVPLSGYGAVNGNSEQYNGTAWTEVNNLTTARSHSAGCGTQAAGLNTGGLTSPPTVTKVQNESWNGSTWTEVADLNTGRWSAGEAGTSTAALFVAGMQHPGFSVLVESWNGSSWTETTEINTGRRYIAGMGIQTAMLISGGDNPGLTPSKLAQTELWNGSSWTEVGDLNTGRYYLAGSGLSTAALVFGGSNPGANALTEQWDGSAWTEVNDLAAAKTMNSSSPSGTTSTAVTAGGYPDPSQMAVTEEWTVASFQVKTLTTS